MIGLMRSYLMGAISVIYSEDDMAAKDVVVMDKSDQVNYDAVLADLITSGTFDKTGIVDTITQIYLIAPVKYIYAGALLRVVGPLTVMKAWKEPSWIKYIYVNDDWDERIFMDIDLLYSFLSQTYPVFKKHRYTRAADKFILADISTFDSSRWSSHVRST